MENTKDRRRRSPVESNPAQELTVTVTVLEPVPDAFLLLRKWMPGLHDLLRLVWIEKKQ